MSEKKLSSKIVDFIIVAILIVVLIKVYGIYKQNNYGDFVKAEYNRGYTSFSRDTKVKYSKKNSYKVESKNFNDAAFYKEIKVKPNTPYKLSCMIKTANVQVDNEKNIGGAEISIIDSLEVSKNIIGTTDWQKVELIFDSKNRESLEIGFRLGGNEANAKGTAWFSDFKLEEGSNTNSTKWNVVCFIIENVDVKLDNNDEIKLQMNYSDIDTIKTNMSRFQTACNQLSNNNMSVTYDTFVIEEPVKTVTYSDTFGYYVDPNDVKKLIEPYLKKEEYDYIFVAVRLGELDTNNEIPVYDWIGLGGMDLYGIGYSNIRLPNSSNSYIYTYNPNVNVFPEEVFVHEYLHSLERICNEYEYDIPELHDNEKYGYKNEVLVGLKDWYADYMTASIKASNGKYVGLNQKVYSLKPFHESDFQFPTELEFEKERINVLEKFKALLQTLKKEE